MTKNENLSITKIIYYIFIITTFIVIIVMTSMAYNVNNKYDSYENVSLVEKVNVSYKEKSKEITIPTKIKNLPHNTTVTATFMINCQDDSELCFVTSYSPVKIYSNGNLIFESGTRGTYTRFFLDPPTYVSTVKLPNSAHPQHIKVVYTSPNSRTTLNVNEFVYGKHEDIISYMVSRHSLNICISIIYLIAGLILIISSLVFISTKRSSRLLFWTGATAFTVGAWGIGENRLMVYISKQPDIMYIFAFLSLFFLVIPITMFTAHFLDIQNSKLIQVMVFIEFFSTAIAIVLQYEGLLNLSTSMYYFHVLLPVYLIILAIICIYNAYKNRSKLYLYFSMAIIMLSLCSILELTNYHITNIWYISSFFELGIVIFIVFSCILAGLNIRNMEKIRLENETLSNELSILESTFNEQKKRNSLVLKYEDDIKRVRHDFRHHIRLLKEALIKKEFDAMETYLNELDDSLPSAVQERFCENSIINSTITFYYAKSKDANISFDVKTNVPVENPNISDSNLCIIVGNLLENAYEACMRMDNMADRFISFKTMTKGNKLFITVDNSFNGVVNTKNNNFISSKTQEIGTGLKSVKLMAEKHQGKATFSYNESIFTSNVYIKIN